MQPIEWSESELAYFTLGSIDDRTLSLAFANAGLEFVRADRAHGTIRAFGVFDWAGDVHEFQVLIPEDRWTDYTVIHPAGKSRTVANTLDRLVFLAIETLFNPTHVMLRHESPGEEKGWASFELIGNSIYLHVSIGTGAMIFDTTLCFEAAAAMNLGYSTVLTVQGTEHHGGDAVLEGCHRVGFMPEAEDMIRLEFIGAQLQPVFFVLSEDVFAALLLMKRWSVNLAELAETWGK